MRVTRLGRAAAAACACLSVAATGGAATTGPAATAPAAAAPAYDVPAIVRRLSDPTAGTRELADFELQCAGPTQPADLAAAAADAAVPPRVRARVAEIATLSAGRAKRAARKAADEAVVGDWQFTTVRADLDARATAAPAWLAAARRGNDRWHAARSRPEAEQAKSWAAADAAFAEAVRLGCDDPNVLAEAALARGAVDAAADVVLDGFVAAGRAAARVPDAVSAYWAVMIDGRLVRARKAGSFGGLDDDAGAAAGNRDLDGMVRGFERLAATPGVPVAVVLSAYDNVTRTAGSFRRNNDVCIAVDAAAVRAFPDDAGVYGRRGAFYVQYAWDARGNGWGNGVRGGQWEAFNHRLALAESALTRAWDLDPTRAQTAEEMIRVAMGKSLPREQMEQWFDRAMTADPDDYDACTAKLLYLEPKWCGTEAELLAFGRECAAGRNWYAALPLVLVDAHLTVAQYAPSRAAYLASDAVWRDVSRVYATQLRLRPDDDRARSYLAYFACFSGHYLEAKAAFDRLGDRLDLAAFDSPKEAAAMKREAAKWKPAAGEPTSRP